MKNTDYNQCRDLTNTMNITNAICQNKKSEALFVNTSYKGAKTRAGTY